MRRMILTGTGLVAVLALSAAAPAALADSPTPSPSAAAQRARPDLARRATRLCRRVPRIEQRVAQVTARFTGDVNTRGSILWLRAKADQVRPGDPTLADIIDGRAKIRQSRLATLKLRTEQLPKVAAWCKAHGR